MKGDLVIVRAFRGVPLVRRIWEESEKVIQITDDTLDSGEVFLPIGFPREDVFRHDPDLAAAIDSLCEIGEWDWDKLTPL